MSSCRQLLHLNFSPNLHLSASYQLVQSAWHRYTELCPCAVISLALEQAFLAQIALPDASFTAASLTPPHLRSKSQSVQLAYSEQWLEQIENSDALLLSLPLHNFSLPASCKAWLDWIMRPWRSFDFSAQGKFGLLQDKPCAILISSGGSLHDGRQIDFASPYLRHALATMGLHQVEFIYLENTRREEQQTAARDQAQDRLVQWLQNLSQSENTH